MRFRMSFDEKEVEDEGMHYTWLLIGSVHPLLSIKINDHSSSQQVSFHQTTLFQLCCFFSSPFFRFYY